MADIQPREITVSNRTVVRVILLTLATFVGIRFVILVSDVIVLVLFSVFLSIALNPGVSWIARKLRLKSRVAAVGIGYLAVVAILGVFMTFVIPPLARQTVDFVSDVPQTITNLRDTSTVTGRFIQRYNLNEQLDGLTDDIKERTDNISEPAIATAGRVGSALVSIITVLVLTFMMLVEGPAWVKRYWNFLPKRRREHHQKLADKMYGIVTGFVNGQLLLSLIAATIAFIALMVASTLLNVSINAVALAGILVFTGLIPMIGSFIGITIVTLACLFVSTPLALIMLAFLVLYQQVENAFVQPYIHAKYNELTPLLVFIAALLGLGFGGVLGGLVAIPVAGCLKVLLLDYLDRRNLRSRS